MKTLSTDVLIVGSGFGGAAPAMRLPQIGLKTTVIEKGPDIQPYQSFKQSHDPKYLLNYYKNISGTRISLQYIEALGGGSGFYEMVSLRAPSLVFSLKNDKGDNMWPETITRESMNKYYERAEQMLNVHQINDNEIPKTGHVFSLLMKKGNFSAEKARYAVKNCQNSGYCISGCIYGSKQSLFLNYLPEAKRNGAEIRTDLEVIAIKPISDFYPDNANLNYRYWVICKDKKAGDEIIYYKTKILILSAGTIGTAKLLLASRENLPDLSKELGKNISFNGSVKAIAQLPDWCPDADMYSGRTHPGMVSYHFLEKEHVMVTTINVSPLQLISATRFDTTTSGIPHWGKDYTEMIKKFRHRMIVLGALGIEPTTASLNYSDGGHYNLSLNVTKELKAHYYKNYKILTDIFDQTGCKIIPFNYLNRKGREQDLPFFSSCHQMGSCRMADHIHRGVVDENGEVFNYPGMYITDGSVIPSSTIVNPSLTILANAERITDSLMLKYISYTKA